MIDVKTDEELMQQCINLALKGDGKVFPNPMVGCVVVFNNEIIGEGYHEVYGGAHAEVNAINSVIDKSKLSSSTLYVSLEPCNHFGKTPPCSDLILKYKIPRVVIGCMDSNILVAGKGIEKLRNAGVEVRVGVLEQETKVLNRRFFILHEKKRPFITIKFAQTKDGFIDKIRVKGDYGNALKITTVETDKYVHSLRAKEQAIIVGVGTALADNPSLTVRHVECKNPIRVVFDKNLRFPGAYENQTLLDTSAKTIFVSQLKSDVYTTLQPKEWTLKSQLQVLFDYGIQSVFVEGGKTLIESFLNENLWDDLIVITSETIIGKGVVAPVISGVEKILFSQSIINGDTIQVYHS